MAGPSTPLFTFVVKDPVTIRSDLLRTISNGLIAQGISNPNVGPGSDYYIIATALANELAVVGANAVLAADQLCPDTAAAANLDRWLAVVGLARSPGTNSFGNITITVSASSTTIVTGQQLQDAAGLLYQVITGGVYTNGAQVPVESVNVGSATNHNNGDILTWAGTAPPYTSPTVTVGLPGGTDGLEGGNDSEVGVDEPPRARLLSRLQKPPVAGNSADIAGWASAASTDVQLAFVYPALLGPSTVFFAVCAAPQQAPPFSSTSKNRDLPTALVTGTILPYVQGLLPEHALCVGTSCANQATDIAILLSLPAATTASPPGPGGGWLDGTPWPSSTSSGTAACTVTSVTNSTQFTVNATTSPLAGVSHISWISPNNWTIYSATVLTVTGSSGAYVITIDTPFPSIANGNYIFPTSVNQSTYLQAVFGQFATMGTGEWTTDPTALKRAFRHPIPSLSNPSSLTAVMLKAIISTGPEVLDANWIYRSTTTPTVPGTPTIDPTTQLLTSSPPNVLVPRQIGFYAA